MDELSLMKKAYDLDICVKNLKTFQKCLEDEFEKLINTLLGTDDKFEFMYLLNSVFGYDCTEEMLELNTGDIPAYVYAKLFAEEKDNFHDIHMADVDDKYIRGNHNCKKYKEEE